MRVTVSGVRTLAMYRLALPADAFADDVSDGWLNSRSWVLTRDRSHAEPMATLTNSANWVRVATSSSVNAFACVALTARTPSVWFNRDNGIHTNDATESCRHAT